jgi:tetratricopeptide (TPR) repeat protein
MKGRKLVCSAALCFALCSFGAVAAPFLGSSGWYRAKLGPFEAISDDGRDSALQALSQFEQFRFALGTAMGQPDLRLNPPLRILVFHDAKDMAEAGCEGIHMGRDRLMGCAVASGQLPAAMVKDLTRRLLDANFRGIPPATEKALETFFSTVESNAVHVKWGAPPPAAERTRDWALLHRMITQPDMAGRAHIYLHNVAAGMDSNDAIRSLGEDPQKFNAEVDRYFAAGKFEAVQAPNRPLSPDRDFVTGVMTSDEGQLARADLLGAGSEAAYTALLRANQHRAEANEGLGFLALRAGDEAKAAQYFGEAYKDGSKNVVALTTYARSEKHYDVAIEVLKRAVEADPKYAPARWELGDKYDDPARRLAEWKVALSLAPHRDDWWVLYARLNEGQKRWAEAGRAWMSASVATNDPAKREQYLQARSRIAQQRLDDEAAERAKAAAAEAAEINRLKAEARQQIAAAEARANALNKKKDDSAPVMEWWGDPNLPVLKGTLTRVDCGNGSLRLRVKEAAGAVRTMLIADPNSVQVRGGEMKFACGPQKPRAVAIGYKPSKAAGVYGEVASFEYQ